MTFRVLLVKMETSADLHTPECSKMLNLKEALNSVTVFNHGKSHHPKSRKYKSMSLPQVSCNYTAQATSIMFHMRPDVLFLPIRPVSCRRNNSFPFQGKSTTKEDFPAQESCCQRLIKQEQQIPNPSGKFDSLSTFRSHYMPHELIPTESCKPVNVLFKSSIPFDDITVYSPERAPKKQEICPASYPSPPGYIFENTNSRGHKFFHTIAPMVKAF